jgi:UDP-glucose 4-epimerase
MRILVTGGTGYIGSHTVIELINADHEVFIIDNLSNSSANALDAIERITQKRPDFTQATIKDKARVKQLLGDKQIEAVIHFAAYKAVAESVAKPLMYYENNVGGMISLLEAMQECSIDKFVFSSSAAVYGNPDTSVVTEETPCKPESPYGWTKLVNEYILRDTCAADSKLSGVALRYFNVVGAHDSGLIGELPLGVPQNILPIIAQATAGKLPPVTIFGTDYDTPDGTCLRDYIHVVDLAKAHVAALEYIAAGAHTGFNFFNIGTGKPTSVLELINTFERINHTKVPHVMGDRRPGDPVMYYANCDKAKAALHWLAVKTVEDSVRGVWQWQQHIDNNIKAKLPE